MRPISEQYHSITEMTSWLKRSYKTLKSLKNKERCPNDSNHYNVASDFWTMGPVKDKPGKYYLYFHTGRGALEEEIRSINDVPYTPYVMIQASNGVWYKMDINKSAWAWAKRLDLFLNGAHTDIPPLNMSELMDMIRD